MWGLIVVHSKQAFRFNYVRFNEVPLYSALLLWLLHSLCKVYYVPIKSVTDVFYNVQFVHRQYWTSLYRGTSRLFYGWMSGMVSRMSLKCSWQAYQHTLIHLYDYQFKTLVMCYNYV